MTLVPPSIRRFRLIYGLVVLLTAANAVLIWPAMRATLARNPEIGAAGWAIVIGTMLVGLAIPVAIWWFAGWRRSPVARIALVLLVLLALVLSARALAGGLVADAATVTRLAALVLQLASLWLLFRPDARTWFAVRRGELAA